MCASQWIDESMVGSEVVSRTAIFRFLHVLHAFDLPGTPTIFTNDKFAVSCAENARSRRISEFRDFSLAAAG
jgi:hypothetical protein